MSVPTTTTTSTNDQALTINLGPLPTAFTPAEQCTALSLAASWESGYKWQRGYRCSSATYLPVPECYPAQYALVNRLARPRTNGVDAVFSPASVCPSGFETRCSMIGTNPQPTAASASSDSVPMFKWTKLREGETAIGCCPSGFVCATGQPYRCISNPSVGETISADFNTDCSRTGRRKTSSWVVKSGWSVEIEALQVVIVQDQTTASTISPATSSPSTASSAAGSNNDTTQGLAAGTKVAIGISVSLGVMIFTLLGYMIVSRKRRRGQMAKDQQGELDNDIPGQRKGELEATTNESLLGLKCIQGGELDATESQASPSQTTIEADCLSELPAELDAAQSRTCYERESNR